MKFSINSHINYTVSDLQMKLLWLMEGYTCSNSWKRDILKLNWDCIRPPKRNSFQHYNLQSFEAFRWEGYPVVQVPSNVLSVSVGYLNYWSKPSWLTQHNAKASGFINHFFYDMRTLGKSGSHFILSLILKLNILKPYGSIWSMKNKNKSKRKKPNFIENV